MLYWQIKVKRTHYQQSKICLKFKNNIVREPLILHERANLPFYKVAADIMTHGNNAYIVVADYYSMWIELMILQNKTATEGNNN